MGGLSTSHDWSCCMLACRRCKTGSSAGVTIGTSARLASSSPTSRATLADDRCGLDRRCWGLAAGEDDHSAALQWLKRPKIGSSTYTRRAFARFTGNAPVNNASSAVSKLISCMLAVLAGDQLLWQLAEQVEVQTYTWAKAILPFGQSADSSEKAVV